MKTCESHAAQLSALVDGELHGWQAWRLRRHAARCPACAREIESWRRMNADLRAADIVPASPVVPIILPQRSRKRSAFAQCLVGCAVVAAGVFGGIFYTTPTRTGGMDPVAARAEVDAAMARVRNAQWRETHYREGKHGEEIIRSITKSSALLDPPVIIRREQTFRSGKQDLTIVWRMDASEMEMYSTESDFAQLDIFRNPKRRWDLGSPSASCQNYSQQMRNSVLRSMYAVLDVEKKSMPKAQFNHNGSLTLLPVAPTLHHVTRNGRLMIEIREGNEFPGNNNNTGWYRVIWADAFTHRITAMEIYSINLSTKRLLWRHYCDQYRYNQNLSADAFVLRVPKGTPIKIDGNYVGGPSQNPFLSRQAGRYTDKELQQINRHGALIVSSR